MRKVCVILPRMEPTVCEPGGVRVVKLYESERERERVGSIEDAIERVRETDSEEPICVKIVARDGSVVYDSESTGDIDAWEAEWRLQKRRIAAAGPVHECPHESPGCTEESLCVECKIDRARERAGAA